MARLTAADRKGLPTGQFGVPSKAKTPAGKAKPGSFPMPDKKHAALAKAMDHGNPNRKAIDAKANKVLGKSAGKPAGKKSPRGK